jgi:hypothetical protein
MLRAALALTSLAALGLGATVYARSNKTDDLVDRVQGVRIASRIPCDGSTNPQQDLKLDTTFSPAGWQRAFHLDVFENQYCRHLDLYFFCAMHGQNRWRHEWVSTSQGPAGPSMYFIRSCAEWGLKDAPEYILSGWYQEGAASKKLPWKQAAIKKVSETPEVYEFADPNGGTARIEIKRK